MGRELHGAGILRFDPLLVPRREWLQDGVLAPRARGDSVNFMRRWLTKNAELDDLAERALRSLDARKSESVEEWARRLASYSEEPDV